MRNSTIAAMIAIVSFGSNAVGEEKFQMLTAAQIQSKFAGMEMTDNVHGGDYYDRDGTLTSYSMGVKRVGTWGAKRTSCVSILGTIP